MVKIPFERQLSSTFCWYRNYTLQTTECRENESKKSSASYYIYVLHILYMLLNDTRLSTHFPSAKQEIRLNLIYYNKQKWKNEIERKKNTFSIHIWYSYACSAIWVATWNKHTLIHTAGSDHIFVAITFRPFHLYEQNRTSNHEYYYKKKNT